MELEAIADKLESARPLIDAALAQKEKDLERLLEISREETKVANKRASRSDTIAIVSLAIALIAGIGVPLYVHQDQTQIVEDSSQSEQQP